MQHHLKPQAHKLRPDAATAWKDLVPSATAHKAKHQNVTLTNAIMPPPPPPTVPAANTYVNKPTPLFQATNRALPPIQPHPPTYTATGDHQQDTRNFFGLNTAALHDHETTRHVHHSTPPPTPDATKTPNIIDLTVPPPTIFVNQHTPHINTTDQEEMMSTLSISTSQISISVSPRQKKKREGAPATSALQA